MIRHVHNQPLPIDFSTLKSSTPTLDGDEDKDYDDEHLFMKVNIQPILHLTTDRLLTVTGVYFLVKTLDRTLIAPGEFYLYMDEVSHVRWLSFFRRSPHVTYVLAALPKQDFPYAWQC